MRKARRDSICGSGIIHKMWRGHNREHVMAKDSEKRAYLSYLASTFTEKIKRKVQWHSYCLMSNHAHEGIRALDVETKRGLRAAVKTFGNWMRNSHSRFGSDYNRRHKRQGKVAYDRPKTNPVKDEQGLLQVMFYGDANPERAGMVSHPSRYRHSSYLFYAQGKTNEYTEHLTPPPAYLALGDTPSKRQKKYRSLCDSYLREQGLIDDEPSEEGTHGDEFENSPNQSTECSIRARGDPKQF